MTRCTLDGRYLGPRPSGIGRYCEHVVSAMQQLDADLRWSFVVRQRGDAHALSQGREIVFDHAPYGPHTTFGLRRTLARHAVDLFHSPFHVLPLGLACPQVITIHDTFNFTQPETSNYPFPISWFEWAYFLAAIPRALQQARRIICVSQTTADDLVRRVPSCKRRVRVVHHGVASQFRPLDAEVVAPVVERVVGGRSYFVHVGAVSPNKNHARMLRAFARAFAGRREPVLVTISRFGDVERLRALGRELGIDQQLITLDKPSDDEVVALFNGALGLLFCSLVEGFGLPVVEAMACGCPVVTSTSSCLPEVAGGAALLVDPLDVAAMARAMRRVAEEPSLRQELSARGLERVASLTWRKAAERHLEVYAEAVR